jgi:hypothetical protein
MFTDLLFCDKQRLSGHKQDGAEDYPTIGFYDGVGAGIGAGNGSLLCEIQCFHWAEVVVKGKAIELRFEGKACLRATGGIVEYCDGVGETDAQADERRKLRIATYAGL